jgi:cell division septation protein DedD
MASAQQDTEITLGTGRMLLIFFAFVLVCGLFFAIGFSLGRKTTVAGGSGSLNSLGAAPATVVRPSANKNDSHPTTPQSGDFSFYKAVGEKNADPALTSPDSKTALSGATASTTATSSTDAAKAAPDAATASPATGSYYVQVAAVTRQEDAVALVEALKKKQYPAFSANNPPNDKFYHVQVGPYADLKEAEAMKARLVGDGYNPIVKK